MITVTLQYFAQLREQARAGSEQVRTVASSPRELYAELVARHGFSLRPETLRVAVNARISDWTGPLRDGDTIVFIPPVAGG